MHELNKTDLETLKTTTGHARNHKRAINKATVLQEKTAQANLEKENDPSPFECPNVPSSWKLPGVSIKEHYDVPMHLLFLGIVKAVAKNC